MNIASEWAKKGREADSVNLPLPSGLTIRARRPDPLQFAEWGELPVLLGRAADQGVSRISDEQAIEIAVRMRDLLVWCCVEPRIATGDVAGEGEILPRDVPKADWQFITAWAMRLPEAAALAAFRRESETVRAGEDSSGVFFETERAAGDRRSSAGADGGHGGGEGFGGRGSGPTE